MRRGLSISWILKIYILVLDGFSPNVYLKKLFYHGKANWKFSACRYPIGGINFYYLNGEPVAREAGGGFNKKAIKKSPKMQIVRDFNSEFGHASHVSKFFRRVLFPFYYGWDNPNFHWELLSMFLKLRDLDVVNKRGAHRASQGAIRRRVRKYCVSLNIRPIYVWLWFCLFVLR